MTRPVALVTGASMGIGCDLARELATTGHDFVLVARSEEKLHEFAGELKGLGAASTVIVLDLAQPGAAQRLYDEVKAQGIVVETLVNNAGFGLKGPFVRLALDEQQSMMHLNIVTLTELCWLFGGDMAARGAGRILNVASVASFQPGPEFGVYSASKAYVLSLSESLAAELRPRGVTVTALCPGAVTTNFHVWAGNDSKFIRAISMRSRPVAVAGHRALMASRPVVVPGLMNKLAVFFVRLMPRQIVTKIAYLMVGRTSPALD